MLPGWVPGSERTVPGWVPPVPPEPASRPGAQQASPMGTRVTLTCATTDGRYWMEVATLMSSSGVIRWSWLSSPISSSTQLTFPVNRLDSPE